MSTVSIPAGSFISLQIGARDDGNVGRSLSELSATIDDTTNAYIAATGNPGEFAIVPKGPASPVTVNVTVNGKSVNGTDVAPLAISADLAGNSSTPQATHLLLVAFGYTPIASSPDDPGAATITIPVS